MALVHEPAAQTARSVAAHRAPINAKPRMRRRPSESFTTGSWKMTTPTASSAKTMPTSFSLIRATFLPNAGSSSTTSEIAAVMKAALSSV